MTLCVREPVHTYICVYVYESMFVSTTPPTRSRPVAHRWCCRCVSVRVSLSVLSVGWSVYLCVYAYLPHTRDTTYTDVRHRWAHPLLRLGTGGAAGRRLLLRIAAGLLHRGLGERGGGAYG